MPYSRYVMPPFQEKYYPPENVEVGVCLSLAPRFFRNAEVNAYCRNILGGWEKALGGRPVQQVWTYNAGNNAFVHAIATEEMGPFITEMGGLLGDIEVFHEFNIFPAPREEQGRRWRAGMPGRPQEEAERLAGRVAELLDSAAVAAPDERSLEVELTLVDSHGIPWWKALGRFGGVWREIATGVWKPERGEGATFTKRFAFRSDAMPGAIRLEHHGYGEAQVRFVSVADRTSRLVPKAVVETDGLVRDAEKILVDDDSAATFGHSGFLDAFRDNALRDAVSSVTMNLTP